MLVDISRWPAGRQPIHRAEIISYQQGTGILDQRSVDMLCVWVGKRQKPYRFERKRGRWLPRPARYHGNSYRVSRDGLPLSECPPPVWLCTIVSHL